VEVLASGEHTSGEICGTIAAEFDVTRAAASWHLRILRENNWVRMRPDYTMRLYRLDDRAIDRLSREVAVLRRLWRGRIGSQYGADPLPVKKKRLAAGAAKGMRGNRYDEWRP